MDRIYKESGIEWIGKIPETWEVRRIKDNIVFNPENTNSNEELEVSYMPMDCLRFNHIDEKVAKYRDVKSYTPFEEGDIVMAKVTPCYENGNIAIAKNLKNGLGYGTSEIFVIRALGSLKTNYLFYYLYTPYVKNRAVSSMVGTGGLKRINPTFFLNTSLLVPPLVEQQRIADYLDAKCGEIDSLIALQEQMIEKLKAYKQSVITEAVTKGLDPNAKLIPSGIDWIGEIPEGWLLSRIKFYGTIKSGEGISIEELKEDGEFPVWGGNGLMGYANKFNQEKLSIVIGRVGALCGNVRLLEKPTFVSDNALIFELSRKIDAQFMLWLLTGANLNKLNTSNAQPLITGTKVKNVQIPVPPLSEQRSIASYLDEKCADIDRLIALKQQKIESLKDYKKSVIYEAVTGKTIIE